jgi:AraC-like DNA-binding protein
LIFENEQTDISHLCRVILYSSGEEKHLSYPGKLPTHELMYYLKGKAILTFHGKTVHMKKGSVLYLPKGIDNTEYRVRVIEPFLLYNIYFDSPSELPREIELLPTRGEEYGAAFERLYRTWVGKRDGYYYRSMQQLYGLLEELHRAKERSLPHSHQAPLVPAEEYMADHYCDADFSYAELVHRSGLSYSYFKKLFIEKYGCPPVRHVTRLRMARAAELLASGCFTVSEVAALCGYESIYYFSNVFKRHTGVAPRDYGKIL